MAWDLNEWTFATRGLPIRDFLQANYINAEIRRSASLTSGSLQKALRVQGQEIAQAFTRALATDPVARIIAGPLTADQFYSSFDTSRIEDGLESLKAEFNWGISEVVWQLELQGKQLQSIIELLMAPLETAAKELRRRAEFAYHNGWVDEAERDFLKSAELNYQDFAVHFSLGHIYFHQRQDPTKALPYFKQTAKYAAPRSTQYAAEACLMASLAHRLMGNPTEAIDMAKKAVDFNSSLLEAHYQLAKLLALLGDQENSVRELETAIFYDPKYCEKARQDIDFDRVRNSVNKLMERLLSEARRKVTGCAEYLKSSFLSQRQELTQIPSQDIAPGTEETVQKIQALIGKIEELMAEGSYFGYQGAADLMVGTWKRGK